MAVGADAGGGRAVSMLDERKEMSRLLQYCSYLASEQLLESLYGELVGVLKRAIVLELFLHSIIRQVRRPACSWH